MVTEDVLAEMPAYHLHPALLDVCLQVMWGIFVGDAETATYVPVGWDKITLYQAPRGNEFWSHARLTAVNGPIRTADIDIYDQEGRCVATVSGAQEQRTSRLALLANAPWQDWLYTVDWRPQALSGDVAEAGKHWLIFAPQTPLAQALMRQLQRRGDTCATVALGDAYEQLDDRAFIARNKVEDLQRVLRAVPEARDIVYLWSQANAPGDLADATQLSCGGALHLLQALMSAESDGAAPILWLVTQGAQAVADEPPRHRPGCSLGHGQGGRSGIPGFGVPAA